MMMSSCLFVEHHNDDYGQHSDDDDDNVHTQIIIRDEQKVLNEEEEEFKGISSRQHFSISDDSLKRNGHKRQNDRRTNARKTINDDDDDDDDDDDNSDDTNELTAAIRGHRNSCSSAHDSPPTLKTTMTTNSLSTIAWPPRETPKTANPSSKISLTDFTPPIISKKDDDKALYDEIDEDEDDESLFHVRATPFTRLSATTKGLEQKRTSSNPGVIAVHTSDPSSGQNDDHDHVTPRRLDDDDDENSVATIDLVMTIRQKSHQQQQQHECERHEQENHRQQESHQKTSHPTKTGNMDQYDDFALPEADDSDSSMSSSSSSCHLPAMDDDYDIDVSYDDRIESESRQKNSLSSVQVDPNRNRNEDDHIDASFGWSVAINQTHDISVTSTKEKDKMIDDLYHLDDVKEPDRYIPITTEQVSTMMQTGEATNQGRNDGDSPRVIIRNGLRTPKPVFSPSSRSSLTKNAIPTNRDDNKEGTFVPSIGMNRVEDELIVLDDIDTDSDDENHDQFWSRKMSPKEIQNPKNVRSLIRTNINNCFNDKTNSQYDRKEALPTNEPKPRRIRDASYHASIARGVVSSDATKRDHRVSNVFTNWNTSYSSAQIHRDHQNVEENFGNIPIDSTSEAVASLGQVQASSRVKQAPERAILTSSDRTTETALGNDIKQKHEALARINSVRHDVVGGSGVGIGPFQMYQLAKDKKRPSMSKDNADANQDNDRKQKRAVSSSTITSSASKRNASSSKEKSTRKNQTKTSKKFKKKNSKKRKPVRRKRSVNKASNQEDTDRRGPGSSSSGNTRSWGNRRNRNPSSTTAPFWAGNMDDPNLQHIGGAEMSF